MTKTTYMQTKQTNGIHLERFLIHFSFLAINCKTNNHITKMLPKGPGLYIRTSIWSLPYLNVRMRYCIKEISNKLIFLFTKCRIHIAINTKTVGKYYVLMIHIILT